LSAKNAKKFPKKEQFTPVMVATMRLAMTVSKSLQTFASAKPILSIVPRDWKKSGQLCHCLASFEKMVAMPF
jgi:hypothetical protein